MWISVHDTVDCSKLRKLAKLAGCSKGEALGVLNAVWLWGAKNADESGLIRDCDEADIAYVALPYLSKGIDSNVFVEKMIESGWIERIDGDLYFHDWEDWQAPWYKYQREKARDTARRRAARRAKSEAEDDSPSQKEEPEAPPGEKTEGQEPAEKPKAKKAKKPPQPKPEKKQYAEFVSMTEDEYGKLVERYGEAATRRMIEVLDNYKGSSGKHYASDYRTILNWVWQRVQEENPSLIRPQKPPEKPAGGLDDIVPDEWRIGRG